MTRYCTNHCRACGGGHFTSLQAFDAHRRDYECVWPDDSGLVEIPNGVCKIGDPDHPQTNITLYEHETAARAREHFAGRQTASTQRKTASVGGAIG
jgi:hypothetical protein